MARFELSTGNALSYDYSPPGDGGVTFVCFNALTGDKEMWATALGEAARAAGHGLLLFNLRGQADSPFDVDAFTPQMIVDDVLALLEHVRPARPVHVGLSIGGLFAAQAHMSGGAGRALALVFINTLRKDTPRLQWINDALVRCVEVGGLQLLRDLYSPLLFGQRWLADNRKAFLAEAPYEPLGHSDGAYMLLKSGRFADWNFPWEKLDVPVLNITGLQDHVFLELDDVSELLGRIPRAEGVEMADCGHLIPAENPGALAAAILDFTSRMDVEGE